VRRCGRDAQELNELRIYAAYITFWRPVANHGGYFEKLVWNECYQVSFCVKIRRLNLVCVYVQQCLSSSVIWMHTWGMWWNGNVQVKRNLSWPVSTAVYGFINTINSSLEKIVYFGQTFRK
jgi:hypothetical protein